MDERWYNRNGKDSDIILVSRIRLLRNFEDFRFPGKMNEEEREKLTYYAERNLKDLDAAVGSPLTKTELVKEEHEARSALLERLLINRAAYESEKKLTVFISRDEAFSLTLNGNDHVRLLESCVGLELKELYEKIDIVDDYISSRMPYAFSRRFGFKTAEITNVGTGMRAYIVMHLPLLAEDKSFKVLSQEIGRYGVVIKEAWSQGARKIGGLYVLYNQRTLGLKENDIIDILTNVAGRLMKQEREIREKTDPDILKDRVLRSYGILKYAVRMDLSEACMYLSDLQLGVSMGYLKGREGLSCYELMLGMLPGNLQIYYEKKLDDSQIRLKRAQYLKEFLNYFDILC